MKNPRGAKANRESAREAGLAGSMIPRAATRMVDQRGEQRFNGLVDDAVLTVRGRERLVRVINVSAEGAMITAPPGLRIGERVALRLAGEIRVEGVVRWIRDGRTGLNFSTPLVIEL